MINLRLIEIFTLSIQTIKLVKKSFSKWDSDSTNKNINKLKKLVYRSI